MCRIFIFHLNFSKMGVYSPSFCACGAKKFSFPARKRSSSNFPTAQNLRGTTARPPCLSRGWGRGRVSYPGPTTFGGPRHRPEIWSMPECTALKRKIQKFSPQRDPMKMFGGQRECFPEPRCGSRRACRPLMLGVSVNLCWPRSFRQHVHSVLWSLCTRHWVISFCLTWGTYRHGLAFDKLTNRQAGWAHWSLVDAYLSVVL